MSEIYASSPRPKARSGLGLAAILAACLALGCEEADEPLVSGATGGATATGVTSPSGGDGNSGAEGGSTNLQATGGAPASGGTPQTTGGTRAASGGTATGGNTSTTGCGNLTPNPFTDCTFAWGAPSSGNRSSYLDFVSTWIGDETNGGLTSMSATATNNNCGDCPLVQQIASTNSMVVFYTYFIGFQARVAGFGDCNVDMTDGHNLCTDGAQWIRDHRAVLVNMYAQYAKKVYAVSPNKPVIWWLEGDFVQYSYTDQSNPLSYAELGQLARDITCAIKSNQPNAAVAMNHSPWISNEQANGFWGAMPLDALDMVWVQGPGNSGTLTNSGTYNATTANYAWLRQKTGKTIMAETSFAASGQDDRWTTTTVSNINARISEGVIGVLVNNPASNYQTAIGNLTPSSTCR